MCPPGSLRAIGRSRVRGNLKVAAIALPHSFDVLREQISVLSVSLYLSPWHSFRRRVLPASKPLFQPLARLEMGCVCALAIVAGAVCSLDHAVPAEGTA